MGQLSSLYRFWTPPGVTVEGVYASKGPAAEGTHWCWGANFGDMGIGYIFIRLQPQRTDGWFFWQCS